MCGRAYSTFTEEEIKVRYSNRKAPKLPAFSANYNLSPTQSALVLRKLGDQPQFDLLRWQLVPIWEPEFKTKLSTINAKSETVFESRLYKSLILRKRCIVPFSGFIEWKRADGDAKRPFCIHLKNDPIMSVAGIWEAWKKDGREYHSFSILTTSANSFMKKIHDRMPVILDPKDEEAWLDPENESRSRIEKLLKPCPSKWLDAWEISPMINSPRNNRKEVLEPVE